ncbi:DNA (cytosine-5-)-methyltransferase [Actinosynnema sp. NPDC050801]|uniref:DNA cytosine methyltransferase n=1 Tax=unclassified Actinosynnema TaxID=2637065 RepID=UPI0033EA4A5F
MRVGSLFSGVGGLDLGVQAVLGGSLAWHAEVDPDASRVLAHHWPDVPNLGDITGVDWSEVEPVDVVTGGFPCQDVSSAGRRAGLRPGTRSGLWSQMAYAVSVLRPRLVIAENVRGLLSAPGASDVEPCPWCLGDDADHALRALGAVLGDLADLGYDTAWCGLHAADVGAPHLRFRIFIAATHADGEQPTDQRGSARERQGRLAGTDRRLAADPDRVGPVRAGQARDRGRGPADDGAPTAHAEGDRRAQRQRELPGQQGWGHAPFGGVLPAADTAHGAQAHKRAMGTATSRAGRGVRGELGAGSRTGAGDSSARVRHVAGRAGRVDFGGYEPAIQRWERVLDRPAPTPTIAGYRGARVLNPSFVEWMQGLPEGWVTGVDGISRTAALRLLGNGVVPQQASAAVPWLLDALALPIGDAA